MFEHKETIIGDGQYGKVKREELPYIDDKGNTKHASFCVTKEFIGSVSPTHPAEYCAQKAVSNYELVKNAGLKIKTCSNRGNVGIDLYKLSPDREKVVMNDLELHGWELLNRQASNMKEGVNKIEIDSEKFKKLAEDMIHQSMEATRKNILLSEDCFFVLIRKREADNVDEMDFIIGDFDNIEENSFYKTKYVEKINIAKTLLTLKYLLETFFINKDQCREVLIGKIEEMINSGIDIDYKLVSRIGKDL